MASSGEPPALVEMRRRSREYAAALDWQRVVEKFAALMIGARDQDPTDHAAATEDRLAATPVGY